MVSPASAATLAVTFTTRVPPTATASLVVTVAVLPLPAAVPLPLVTSYPVMVTPAPGRSVRLITSPLPTTAGPSLVMVNVKLVLPPATTRSSSATLVMLNTDSWSTGIGGVSSSSSFGSVSGSLSGPHTSMPLVMVSPASAATSAVTLTTIVPPTAILPVVVSTAALPSPATVAAP